MGQVSLAALTLYRLFLGGEIKKVKGWCYQTSYALVHYVSHIAYVSGDNKGRSHDPGQCCKGVLSSHPCPPVVRKSASFHPPRPEEIVTSPLCFN